MLRNYFKVAWRNLFQNKTLSFINIFGLAIGMAFAMLIGLWIQFETSFDRFHKNIERLALVRKHTLFNNNKNTQVGIMLPLYDELKNKYPEVKRATRIDWGNSHSLMVGKDKFNKKGLYVDPDFLEMYSFGLVKGSVQTALKDPNSIVLTESLAKTLFKDANPLGKYIKLDNKYNVHVTAVVKDAPKNSSINFEFLAPFEFKVMNFDYVRNAKDSWGNNFLANMVELKEGASMDALSKKIGPLIGQKDNKIKNQTLFLQPMKEMHLYDEFKDWKNSGGRIEYVRLFGIIGIFVLLIACINFMNLATARSEKRAKEVGIRKAVGSQRGQLIAQFLTESLFTSFLAFLLSLVLIQILIPYLKDLGFENIRFDFNNLGLMASVFGVSIITGLFAGSYPALYLSSFMPIKVLKGIMKQGRGAVNFRKVLVVSQFVISIGLIIGTVIVFQQINHARNRSIGYDPDNVITVGASEDLVKNFAVLKQDLLNTGNIEAVTKASSPLTGVYNSWSDFSWEGKDPNTDMVMDVVMTEWDYEKVGKLKFIAGRPFSREYKTDSSGMILNQAALSIVGYKDPIGKKIKIGDDEFTIIGIIENVVMRDPFKPVSPGVIIFVPDQVNVIMLRLKDDADLRKSLAAMQPIFDKHNPALPFEYTFADQEFGKKFATENQAAKLSGIFAILTIFISCLGLYGLAMFMAERRSREISIRKVLGASVPNLWMLLSREFMILVTIACLIASPLAFWFMREWLQKYDYRIEISWWIFLIAAVTALFITLVTVSFQAIKAAIATPVNALRRE